jgi:hypothetical protein
MDAILQAKRALKRTLEGAASPRADIGSRKRARGVSVDIGSIRVMTTHELHRLPPAASQSDPKTPLGPSVLIHGATVAISRRPCDGHVEVVARCGADMAMAWPTILTHTESQVVIERAGTALAIATPDSFPLSVTGRLRCGSSALSWTRGEFTIKDLPTGATVTYRRWTPDNPLFQRGFPVLGATPIDTGVFPVPLGTAAYVWRLPIQQPVVQTVTVCGAAEVHLNVSVFRPGICTLQLRERSTVTLTGTRTDVTILVHTDATSKCVTTDGKTITCVWQAETGAVGTTGIGGSGSNSSDATAATIGTGPRVHRDTTDTGGRPLLLSRGIKHVLAPRNTRWAGKP